MGKIGGKNVGAPNQLRLQLQQRLQGQQQLLQQNRQAALLGHFGAPVGLSLRAGIPQQPQPQPPLNAQMLAQRQRELYSQQHRQRQLMQQRALLMRQQQQQQQQQQNFGNSAMGTPLGTPRLPQGGAQQFPFPPGYGTSGGGAGGFGGPEAAALGSRGGLGGRGMMAAPFGAGMGPAGMQQNLFQYSGAGMAPQSDPAGFAPALSPGSPLMSPQLPPAPPAPGYQSPELKSWQAGAVGNNGVFGPAGAAAPQGMYNNMSITVSMAGPGPGSGSGGSGGVPGGVPGMGAMGGGIPMNPVMAGINSMCSEQVPDAALRPPGLYCNQLGSGELLKAEADGAQVQQVQVFADVQCTVNLVGDPYLNAPAPLANPKNPAAPPPPPPGQGKSLLQQLLTE
ncbi:nuclear receptor coactivator 1-like [Onychostruthus taczanowskii]|uniref:nuclear receptor coactivator 1-like n=1 Tax=Onychostruthus taczanowskii TaxID=356909 RepID=UPI001B80035C|nr:nuclear receptor coactivator 1-like [Onychostruthus taczanowskii]